MPVSMFWKYEGLGNDFIVVRVQREGDISAAEATRLCDRRFGVGADGVLLVLPARNGGADARMVVLNSDGSRPEMCGNGLRCVALHLASAPAARPTELLVETDSGVRRCAVSPEGADSATVEVDMGTVRVIGDRLLDVDGSSVNVAVVDAGNPHVVMFREDGDRAIDVLGPKISTHAAFPRGTNVEFFARRGDELVVWVWERGAGRTLACGTGACAVVADACAKGIAAAGAWVRVRLPGGLLDVVLDGKTGRVTLRGPARRVFSGQLEAGAGPAAP